MRLTFQLAGIDISPLNKLISRKFLGIKKLIMSFRFEDLYFSITQK